VRAMLVIVRGVLVLKFRSYAAAAAQAASTARICSPVG